MIRIFDLFFSLLGLFFLSPVLILLWIVGWFDNGSPFFKQSRLGLFQRTFTLLKFRSMPIDTLSVPTHLVNHKNTSHFGLFSERPGRDFIMEKKGGENSLDFGSGKVRFSDDPEWSVFWMQIRPILGHFISIKTSGISAT